MDDNGWQGASVVIAGLSGIAALLGWITGRNGRAAETEKAIATARKFNSDAADSRDKASAEFEKSLNERASFVLSSYENRVRELTAEIDDLKRTIKYLHEVLDETTKKLMSLQSQLDAMKGAHDERGAVA